MSGLAVTEGGSSERIMFVGEKELVVKQRWALHARHGLQLYTSLVNDKVRGGVGKEQISNPQATETSLSEMARLKAEEVCLLYTSPSPRDKRQSRMPSSA